MAEDKGKAAAEDKARAKVKVKFLAVHPLFAHQVGDAIEIEKSRLDELALVENKFVHLV